MTIADICRRNPVTIAPEASIQDAARLMRERHVGLLVVVQASPDSTEQVVSGVLTDRDIVTAVIARSADPEALKVGDVMTPHPALCHEGYSPAVALRFMRDRGVRRMPVVGARDHLVGVISIDDILDEMAKDLGTLAEVLHAQRQHERATRP